MPSGDSPIFSGPVFVELVRFPSRLSLLLAASAPSSGTPARRDRVLKRHGPQRGALGAGEEEGGRVEQPLLLDLAGVHQAPRELAKEGYPGPGQGGDPLRAEKDKILIPINRARRGAVHHHLEPLVGYGADVKDQLLGFGVRQDHYPQGGAAGRRSQGV